MGLSQKAIRVRNQWPHKVMPGRYADQWPNGPDGGLALRIHKRTVSVWKEVESQYVRIAHIVMMSVIDQAGLSLFNDRRDPYPEIKEVLELMVKGHVPAMPELPDLPNPFPGYGWENTGKAVDTVLSLLRMRYGDMSSVAEPCVPPVTGDWRLAASPAAYATRKRTNPENLAVAMHNIDRGERSLSDRVFSAMAQNAPDLWGRDKDVVVRIWKIGLMFLAESLAAGPYKGVVRDGFARTLY